MAKEELDVLGQMLVARRVKQRLFGACAPLRGTRYVPLERIGRGGGGTVYRAYDSKLRREVAIKLLHVSTGPGRAEMDQASQVVMREARSLASLAHPHVVAVHDVGRVANGELVSDLDQGGRSDASVFLVMELVEGQDLGTYISEQRPNFSDILALFEQAASGLSAAHEIGLIHRDFKPANVLVGKDGRVRVIDFGLARIASLAPEAQPGTPIESESALEEDQSTRLVGTPAYMSPEARDRLPIGARSDQFSFCVAFYEAIYGLRPEACGPGQPLARLSPNLHPLPAGTPEDFAERLAKGLRADPEQRYENMAQLMLSLRSSRRRWFRPWWPLLGALLLGLLAWQCWEAWTPAPCREHPVAKRLHQQIDYWSEFRQQSSVESSKSWLTFAPRIEDRLRSELERFAGACQEGQDSVQRLDPWTDFHLDAGQALIALSQGGARPPSARRLDAWLQDFHLSRPQSDGNRKPRSELTDPQWQRCTGALLAADLEWLRAGARGTSQRSSLLTCLPPDAPDLQIQVARRLARMQGDSNEALRRAYFAALAQERRGQASSFAAGLALELLEHGAGWERAWEWYEHARALDPKARGAQADCAFLRYVAQRIHLEREPSTRAYAQSLSLMANQPTMSSYRWRLHRNAIDFERARGDFRAARALREGLRSELEKDGALAPAELRYLALEEGADLLLEGQGSHAEERLSALAAQPGASEDLDLRLLLLWSAWTNQNFALARARLEELTDDLLLKVSEQGCQGYEQRQWRALLQLETRILSTPSSDDRRSTQARLQARCPIEEQAPRALDWDFSLQLLGDSRRRLDEALRLLDPGHGRCPPPT